MEIARSEYPRPQFVRPAWECLNGEWEFEIDAGDSGLERGLLQRELSSRIQVPFCPESPLSGIGHTDFMPAVWYRRTITLPSHWADREILIHFQAVDYDATVWANGVEVGRHRGGFTPFACSLRGIATGGDEVTLVVRARDENKTSQPRGKQSRQYAPHGCHYTRTTGIWQTVWMEPVPRFALRRPRVTPDLANSLIRLEQPITGNHPGLRLHATLRDADGVVSTAECAADWDLAPRLDLPVPPDRRRLWSPSDPHLYDLEITLLDAEGAEMDRAMSYAGLRSVTLDGKAVRINGEVVFQRLVLDQGYYPDGVMTAPTDAALQHDIELAMAAGYNGARLHQKVFEERFLYHADRMGYLVWGEFADWGCSGLGPQHDHQQPGITYAAQWLEVLERDYSHPSIVGWCPLNETWQNLHDRITVLDDATRALFLAAKAMDTTRPVLDTSGYAHRVPEADIYDSHDYIGDADFNEGLKRFTARHSGLAEGKPFLNKGGGDSAISIPYRGQPYFVSEFGGIRWSPEDAVVGDDGHATTWGYGSTPVSLEDFYWRFETLCGILLDNPDMFGYCYTQLTDVFPELNGIYTFDRKEKFDMARIRNAQTREAAIERRHRAEG
jgi:beta-galactosidase/beta-glucuronidase